MEVFTEKVCIKINDIDYATKKNLREEISSIDDVIFIKEIELLSHEKNEQKLLAVIDSVDERRNNLH